MKEPWNTCVYCVFQRAASVVVLPSGIPTPMNLDAYIGFQGQRCGCGCGCTCWCRLVLVMLMRLDRNTPSNVNLTVWIHFARSKSITLRLIPSDGWKKSVEQPSLEFRLYVRQSQIVGRGVAGRGTTIGPNGGTLEGAGV